MKKIDLRSMIIGMLAIALLVVFACEDKEQEKVYGCTDPTACNFNPEANIFDNSCVYDVDECGVCDGDGIPEGFCDCENNVINADGCCGEEFIGACGRCVDTLTNENLLKLTGNPIDLDWTFQYSHHYNYIDTAWIESGNYSTPFKYISFFCCDDDLAIDITNLEFEPFGCSETSLNFSLGTISSYDLSFIDIWTWSLSGNTFNGFNESIFPDIEYEISTLNDSTFILNRHISDTERIEVKFTK